MEYHEVRIVAELRKQREHKRAEEVRLKAMRGTRRRIPEHLVPLAGTPSDSPPLQVADRYRQGGVEVCPPEQSGQPGAKGFTFARPARPPSPRHPRPGNTTPSPDMRG